MCNRLLINTRLQHTATRCNILQHTATHYNTLQQSAGEDESKSLQDEVQKLTDKCTAELVELVKVKEKELRCETVLHCAAGCCRVLQGVAVCCSVLQVLQCVAVCCS